MMMNLFLDIAPLPEKRIRMVERVVADSVDTVKVLSKEIVDGVQPGGHHGLPYIIGAAVAVLIAIGICLLMVGYYRRQLSQQTTA